jgi:hypothetical protein
MLLHALNVCVERPARSSRLPASSSPLRLQNWRSPLSVDRSPLPSLPFLRLARLQPLGQVLSAQFESPGENNISATAVTEATRPGTTYAFVDVIASPRARCYSKIDSRVTRIPGSMVAHVGWVRVSMLLEISLFGASPTSLSEVLLVTSHYFLERYSP